MSGAEAAELGRDAESARWQSGLYGWFARNADDDSDSVTLDRAGWVELVRSVRGESDAELAAPLASLRRVMALSETCFRLIGVLRLYHAAGAGAQADPDVPDEVRRLLADAAADVDAELAAAEAALDEAPR